MAKKPPKLNERQRRFAHELAKGNQSKTSAARKAGYADPPKYGSLLAKNSEVSALVKRAEQMRLDKAPSVLGKAEAAIDKLQASLDRVDFSDLGPATINALTAQLGNVKAILELQEKHGWRKANPHQEQAASDKERTKLYRAGRISAYREMRCARGN